MIASEDANCNASFARQSCEDSERGYVQLIAGIPICGAEESPVNHDRQARTILRRNHRKYSRQHTLVGRQAVTSLQHQLFQCWRVSASN